MCQCFLAPRKIHPASVKHRSADHRGIHIAREAFLLAVSWYDELVCLSCDITYASFYAVSS
jgi:hypothetical protein